jgi:CelD/BcsL family acetyltransferase involved in cellulose biosynthesis
MIAVETIREPDGLAALEADWWGLWLAAPAATPFQSPAWLIPWWRAFAPGQLTTIAVRRDGRLVGLAPYYLEAGAHGRRLLPLGIGISDYLDVLLAPDQPEAGPLIAAAFAGLPEHWDCLELEELAPDAAGHGLPCPPSCTETRAVQAACPGLGLVGGCDGSGLPLAIPGKRRQSFRRKCAAVAAAGGLELVEAQGDDAVEALAALHGARWRGRGEAGVFGDARVLEFQREAVPRLMARGLARLTLARIGGRLAGAYYRLTWPGHAAAYLGGFDPAFARESPMTILIGEGLRAAAADGARDFSFLRGREAYKYHWGASDRWNRRRSFRRAA